MGEDVGISDGLNAYGALTGRRSARIAVLGALLSLAVLFSLVLGSSPAGILDVLRVGLDGVIFWELRVPRVIMGLLVGSGLAVGGAVTQAVLRNPLASPFTLGVASGAGFGAALGIVLVGAISKWAVAGGAFGFALVTALFILGVARMGVNTVEREGVSFSHPARFVLVGTMNPEEGELRPQLLDRFGLCVQVEGILDIDSRVEVVKRRAAYEDNPAGFAHDWEAREQEVAERVERARALLPRVGFPDELLRLVAQIAVDMGVDGHRADLVMMKTAKTLAALDGRGIATREDVGRAAELALPHRMRKKPFQDIGLDKTALAGSMEKGLAK